MESTWSAEGNLPTPADVCNPSTDTPVRKEGGSASRSSRHTASQSSTVAEGAVPTPVTVSQPASTHRHALPARAAHAKSPTDAEADKTAYIAAMERSYLSTLAVRRRLLEFHRAHTAEHVAAVLDSVNLSPPEPYPAQRKTQGHVHHLLDRNKQATYSEFLRRSKMSLSDFVRVIRGETANDPRPNKALELPDHLPGWPSYRYRSRWEAIVRHGVIPRWSGEFPRQVAPPRNHASLAEALNCVVKRLREGQDKGQCLILDIDLFGNLEGVTCSPFGAASKGSSPLSIKARTIQDLSYPDGLSINDATLDSIEIEVGYDGAVLLAHRILHVDAEYPERAKMASGDVTGAFRNVPIHADHVGRFAGVIPELGLLVIDLACPFGWSDSPRQYWIAGGAIKHIYDTSAPAWPGQPEVAAGTFDPKTWCDDQNCIEPDVGSRLSEANICLRQAMIAVLGPESMNEEKFTGWFIRGQSLGLILDLGQHTLSMPDDKIVKASDRVQSMLDSNYTSRTLIRKLLGSLRHVVTCVRSAKPFFQRLSDLARTPNRAWRLLEVVETFSRSVVYFSTWNQ